MSGKVLSPLQWYNKKLQYCPGLSAYTTQLNKLKEFVDFLQSNNMYMSVIGDGRDTINSSIYLDNSTDKENWVCDIKFFDKNKFANTVEVVCIEQMNTVGDIYQNLKFASVLEVLTDKTKQYGKYSSIKQKIDLDNFCDALDYIKKSIKIYKVFC